MNTRFDVVVVGGGHAGIEAAHAAARMGCRTMLLTMDPLAIGRMSCNPAMGGLGKGHVIREIDALGGLQALATDAAGIQFRTLNRSNGPAVQAPRVQCDKDAYTAWMYARMSRVENLEMLGGVASEILHEGARITGLRLEDGTAISCRALILTTGTFLDSVMHTGPQKDVGGRVGERSADTLSRSFLELGLETGRLKTGTPCRLWSDSIDFSKTEVQPGDEPPPPASFRTGKLDLVQMPCHLTRTGERTLDIIRENMHTSPMYLGEIKGVGARYCPSIEDKVSRFPDKTSHNIFLEPETRRGDTIYPNGISTSLPAHVQEAFVRSVPGLENARFARYGYAVEYTYVTPRQLHLTLETKPVKGLFLAGQINGTSGYEEAAGQGLVAGVNAALSIQEKEPLLLGRDEAYIGVMIDDLVTKDHREPYRLFTSRAEYRIVLRADNADLRLLHHAERLGLLSEEETDATRKLGDQLREKTEMFRKTTLRTSEVDWELAASVGAPKPDKSLSLQQYLCRPEMRIDTMRGFLPWIEEGEPVPSRLWGLLENDLKYEGYLKRQYDLIERTRSMEETRIPEDIDYRKVSSIREEARQVLERFRPDTLGAAGRLAGVNPADITNIMLDLHRREKMRG